MSSANRLSASFGGEFWLYARSWRIEEDRQIRRTIMKTTRNIVRLLVLTSFIATAQAQEVSIPDPGLNAAIREALQKPSGPLTEQDLLSLTNLNACCRSVKSLEGLGAAHNLTVLYLGYNQLTSLTLPAGLGQLSQLVLRRNPL